MYKRFLIALFAAGMFGISGATTYYVDCQMDDYTGHDGKTAAKALKTIQEGVDKCAKSGDTVLVAPGDYNHGNRSGGGGFPSWGLTVFKIIQKQVTIRSSGGPDVTFITGRHGSHVNNNGQPDGTGVDTNDFVRCIATYGTESEGSIIEGFTIRNGSCLYGRIDAAYNAHQNGGIFNGEGGRVYVVDCVLTNCIGGDAQVYNKCTFVRSKIINHDLRGPSDSPTLAGDCHFLNCYIAHNTCWKNGIIATGSGLRIVNTTFVANTFSQCAYNSDVHICNSIVNGSINRTYIPETYASVVTGSNYDGPPYAVLAPPLDDYRIRRGSGAETMGDAIYLDEVPLPSGVDRYLDIDRNPIPTGGPIAIGCCQEVVEPAGGGVWYSYGNKKAKFPEWRVDGGPIMRTDSYVFPGPEEAHAFRFEFLPANPSQRFVYMYCTYRDNPTATGVLPCGRTWNNFAEGDSSLYQLPPSDRNKWICLNEASESTSVLYLDSKASSAGADGSEDRPFRTLKDAIESDLSGGRPILLLKPGVYDEGVMDSVYEKSQGGKARIVPGTKTVMVVGLEGPEKTSIVGAPDPDVTQDTFDASGNLTVPKGCGPKAVRISISGGQIPGIGSGMGGVLLHGLTLAGGYSNTSDGSTAQTYNQYSGAMVSESAMALACNCVISNNSAVVAGAGHWVFYDRCRIFNNRNAYSSTIINNCYLTGCLIFGNTGYRITTRNTSSKSINSVFVGLDRSTLHYNSDPNGDHCNNIYLNGTNPSAEGDRGGSIYWNFDSVPQVLESHIADPLLMKPEKGDARLFAGSPAVENGVYPTHDNDWFMMSCDLDGKPWRFRSDGVGVSGASQTVVTNGIYLAGSQGGLSIDGENGYYELKPDAEALVQYEDGATRPVGGVTVNGETKVLPMNISAADLEAAGGSILILPAYTNVWYVDAKNGNDGNFGYTTNNAFKTLQRAMENVNLIKGDRVLAMPGVYAEGAMMPPGEKFNWADYAYPGFSISSRVVVPIGVTLESIYGSAVTTIRGKAATTPAEWMYSATDDMRGMGDGAMHAVTLCTDARVKGFTITEGFTKFPKNKGVAPYAANHSDPDFCGGGVTACYSTKVSARSQCWAEECFFTNNAAFRGGGVMAVNCLNCVFVDNIAAYGGGATSDSKIYGCLSMKNDAQYPHSVFHDGFFYGREIHNSTMFDGFCLDVPGSTAANSLCNNLILFQFNYSGFQPECVVNCAINTDVSSPVPQIYAAVSNANHCIYTSGENLKLDENYRPIRGLNPVVDAGNTNLMPVVLEKDAGGIQRVFNNGLIDIGAFEFDWRAVYTADISNSKRINVTEASPAVFESFEKTVRLPTDTKVVTCWLGDSGKLQNFSCSARVSGSGTLIATLNGEELGRIEGTGEREFAFANTIDVNTLVFTYSGADGFAELLATGRGGGSLIICR